MDDTKIESLLDKWLAPAKATAAMFERVAALTNPETIFHQPKAVARVINLQRTYDIATEHRPWLHRDEQFRCYDRISFDHDPEGRWHIYGVGASPNAAMSDLMENIGDEIAKGDL